LLNPKNANVELEKHQTQEAADRRAQIAEFAMRYRIPTSCAFRDQAAAGCLMSYGADVSVTFREAGNYVGRILKGENPADLPVLQPTKFELVIISKPLRHLVSTYLLSCSPPPTR
jgi:ABC-type uncharacterized transport system substrate-binding protein